VAELAAALASAEAIVAAGRGGGAGGAVAAAQPATHPAGAEGAEGAGGASGADGAEDGGGAGALYARSKALLHEIEKDTRRTWPDLDFFQRSAFTFSAATGLQVRPARL